MILIPVQIPVQADTFLQQTNTNYNWGGNNVIYARRNITIKKERCTRRQMGSEQHTADAGHQC